MGLFSGLFGNAGVADIDDVKQEIGGMLADGEQIDIAFSLIRDLIVFTNRRLILIDKQGLTGSKVDYQSIPYRSVVRFSAETKGHFDLESELVLWLSSTEQPIRKTFAKDSNILAVQKALATYVCK